VDDSPVTEYSQRMVHLCTTPNAVAVKLKGLHPSMLHLTITAEHSAQPDLELHPMPGAPPGVYSLSHRIEMPVMVVERVTTKRLQTCKIALSIYDGSQALLARSELQLADHQDSENTHYMTGTLPMSSERDDIEVSLSFSFTWRAIGRHAHGSVSEVLRYGQAILKMTVKKLEIRRAGGNDKFDTPDQHPEFANLPKKGAIQFTKDRQELQLTAHTPVSHLQITAWGWRYVFADDPLYIPVTLLVDATRKAPKEFLPKYVKLEMADPYEDGRSVVSHNINISNYIDRMTRKTDAVLEFDDKEHPAWYPRAEVTIELLSDPDDVDLLFRKLGVPRTKHTFERAAESGVLQVKRPPALDGELCVHIESCQIVGILDHFWEPRAVITVIREDGVREAPQQMDAVPCGPSMVSLDSTIKLTMRLQDSIEITLLAKKGFRPNG